MRLGGMSRLGLGLPLLWWGKGFGRGFGGGRVGGKSENVFWEGEAVSFSSISRR